MAKKKSAFASAREHWLVRLAPVVGTWVVLSQHFGFSRETVVIGCCAGAVAVFRTRHENCCRLPDDVMRTALKWDCRGVPKIVRERVCGSCGAVRGRTTSSGQ